MCRQTMTQRTGRQQLARRRERGEFQADPIAAAPELGRPGVRATLEEHESCHAKKINNLAGRPLYQPYLDVRLCKIFRHQPPARPVTGNTAFGEVAPALPRRVRCSVNAASSRQRISSCGSGTGFASAHGGGDGEFQAEEGRDSGPSRLRSGRLWDTAAIDTANGRGCSHCGHAPFYLYHGCTAPDLVRNRAPICRIGASAMQSISYIRCGRAPSHFCKGS